MMSFPSLPTDSLYKFMSVFGIVLVVSAMYLYQQAVITQWKQNYEHEVTLRDIKQRQDSLHEADADFRLKIDEVFNEGKKAIDSVRVDLKNPAMRKRKSINSLKARLFMSSNREDSNYKKLKKEIIPYSNMANNLSRKSFVLQESVTLSHDLFIANCIVFLVVFLIGWTLAFWGCIAWYLKIQKFQDELITLQVQQLRKELNEPKKVSGHVHFQPQILPRRNAKR